MDRNFGRNSLNLGVGIIPSPNLRCPIVTVLTKTGKYVTISMALFRLFEFGNVVAPCLLKFHKAKR